MAKKEEEKKMIDFTKCKVEQIDGTFTEEDLSKIAKDVAKLVFPQASELAVYNACMLIYNTGKCDYEEVIAEAFASVIDHLLIGEAPASIVLKKALHSALEP